VNHGSVIHVETGELYPFRPMEIQALRAWPRPRSRRLQPDMAWKGFPPHLHLPGGLVFAQRLAVIEYRLEPPTLPLEELPSLLKEAAGLRCSASVPAPYAPPARFWGTRPPVAAAVR
jgi:hypothetical protein